MKLLSSRYVTSQEGNHQETIFYQLVLVLNCGYINLSLSPPRFTWGRGQGGRPAICRSEPDPKKSSEYQLIGSVSCSSYHLIFFKMSLITDSVNMKLRFCVVSMCWQRHWNQKCYLNICAGVFAYIKVFFLSTTALPSSDTSIVWQANLRKSAWLPWAMLKHWKPGGCCEG